MAYSIQREVSDGTLQTLTLRITYFKKTHIFVYVDDKLADGSAGRYSWVWDGDRIRLSAVVPTGVEVLIRRKTPMDTPFHNFRQGAVFKDVTMDENFIQQLYINQENVEGLSATDFYSDLDLHNYRLKNVGTATTDTDVVTLGQYRADALGANQYRILAENSKVAAKAAEVASAASAAAALVSENKSKASETAAKASEDSATASKNATKASETAAKASETAAKASEVKADASATVSTQQADFATSQAVKAKAEADRAGSIVGFEPVPLPNVWIPFTEGLDMLAGINFAKKKVKFGDDIVLIPDNKTVSFSRASVASLEVEEGVLKYYGVDDPRICSRGILLEPQATNYLKASSTLPDSTHNTVLHSKVLAPDGVTMVNSYSCTNLPSNYVRFGVVTPSPVTDPRVSSVWVKKISGSGNVTLSCEDRDNIYLTPTDTWVRYHCVRTSAAVNRDFFDIRFTDNAGDLVVAVFGGQVEDGINPTSLITTNGTQVTRAQDNCWIQYKDNVPSWFNRDNMCIAAEIDSPDENSCIRHIIRSSLSTGEYRYLTLRYQTEQVLMAVKTAFQSPIQCGKRAKGLVALSIVNGYGSTVYNSEIGATGTEHSDATASIAGTKDPEHLLFGNRDIVTQPRLYSICGFIRNVRIWHRGLTNAQLKGLK